MGPSSPLITPIQFPGESFILSVQGQGREVVFPDDNRVLGPLDSRGRRGGSGGKVIPGFGPDERRYCLQVMKYEDDPVRPGRSLQRYYLNTGERVYGPYRYAAFRFHPDGRLFLAYLRDGKAFIETVPWQIGPMIFSLQPPLRVVYTPGQSKNAPHPG